MEAKDLEREYNRVKYGCMVDGIKMTGQEYFALKYYELFNAELVYTTMGNGETRPCIIFDYYKHAIEFENQLKDLGYPTE